MCLFTLPKLISKKLKGDPNLFVFGLVHTHLAILATSPPVQICWLCGATKGHGGDNDNMHFTNSAPNAPFWATFLASEPWLNPPPYSQLIGFNIEMIAPDLLHVVNMGFGRDIVGSILKTILMQQHVFTDGTIDARLQAATQSLKQFARLHAHPLRLKKLTKKKLGWKAHTYAELRTGSGYDIAVTARWLEELLQPHSQMYPDYCCLLWSLNLTLSTLYSASFFLTPQEKYTVKAVGSVFVRTFLKLCCKAVEDRQYLFRCKPKLHLFDHIVKSERRINFAKYSTWMDEDYLKRVSRTLRLTCATTAQKRVLQRWLMAVPESLRSSMASA